MMNGFDKVLNVAVVISLCAATYPYIGYPLLLALFGRLFGKTLTPPILPSIPPMCSLIIPVHNGAGLIQRKIENALALDFPQTLLQVIVVCDGCDDDTVRIARESGGSRIEVLELPRCGKNRALNAAVDLSKGEILVFSDLDGMFTTNALRLLLRWFDVAEVGGVVGHKIIGKLCTSMDKSQNMYLGMQDRIRSMETKLNSSATNEGKLYAIRRTCWHVLSDQGCDDFFNLLQVVASGKRFVFEPHASVIIAVPSVDIKTEVNRRRRIVKGSMVALWRYRRLFNPLRSGWFAFMLWSHKLGRRLAPLFLITFAGALAVQAISLMFTPNSPMPIKVVGASIVICLMALPVLIRQSILRFAKSSGKFPFGAFVYFTVGNWGTVRGLIDFIFNTGNAVYWSTPKRLETLNG
jgi:cellulose synthase/poly-beta-1,6-N-acetylglucosamine synthase-like glycosyltransferase